MAGEHTPGPWAVENASDVMLWIGAMRVPDEARYGLHTIITGIDIEGLSPEARTIKEANARLIAAAPDLLRACEAFLRCIVEPKGDDDTSDVDAAVRLAIAAVKKARGGT